MIVSAIFGMNVGPISDKYSLLITPADYAFYIWWVIYFFGGLYWLYGMISPSDSFLVSSTGSKIEFKNSYSFEYLHTQIVSNPRYDPNQSYVFVAGSLWHASVIGIKFSLLQVLNGSWIIVFGIGNDLCIVIACVLSIIMLIVLTFIEVHNDSFSEISMRSRVIRENYIGSSVLWGPFYTPCDYLCNAGINITRRVSSWQKALVVDLTFAIEQAWLMFATTLGISIVVNIIWQPSENIAQWVSMAVLIVVYCIVGVYGYLRANPYTTLVGAWANLAIYVNSHNDVVSYTSLVIACLLFVEYLGYQFYYITRMGVRFHSGRVGKLMKHE